MRMRKSRRVSTLGSLSRIKIRDGNRNCCSNLESQNTTHSPYFRASISILGLNVSSDCQYRDHLESKAKLASKKLGVINRARRYFTPKHRLALYRAQVRPHMEYCSHLWAGAPQYQLEPFDRIQRRAIRIIGDPMICERLDTLALRRDVSSLCLYRIYHGALNTTTS